MARTLINTSIKYVGDLQVLPGDGRSIAVSEALNYTTGLDHLSVFRDTILRARSVTRVNAGDYIVVTNNGQTIWGLGDGRASSSYFKRYDISEPNITEIGHYPNLLLWDVSHIAYQNGRIYLQNGQIIGVPDAGSPVALTRLEGVGSISAMATVTPALDSNVIYATTLFLELKLYDKTSFKELKSYKIFNGHPQGTPSRMISLGKGRVAMITYYSDYVPNKRLVLFNSKPCKAAKLDLKITASPTLKVCWGDTITLNAAPGYANYIWSNGVQGGPSLRFTHRENTEENISYRVIGPNGCLSESSPVVKILFSPPSENIYYLSRKTEVCPGEKAFIGAGGSQYITYSIWSTGDTILPNEAIEVPPGKYSVRVMDSRGGCLSEPRTIEVSQINPEGLVKPTITANGPLTYCDGKLTTLSAPKGAFGYEWLNRDTAQSVTPKYSGRFAVRLLYDTGCKSVWSDTLAIDINKTPAAPVIREEFFELRISDLLDGRDSVQWSRNNTHLRGTKAAIFRPSQPGIYTLRTFKEGCASPPSLPVAYPQPVKVEISTTSSGPSPVQTYTLWAEVSPRNNYRYRWALRSDTSNNINVTSPGTYCVTVTRRADGATATGCIEVKFTDRVRVSVYGSFESISGMPLVIYDRSKPLLPAVDTVVTNKDGFGLFENLPKSSYIIRAIPPPGSRLADRFLPTYLFKSALWSEAYFVPTGVGLQVGNVPSQPWFQLEMLPSTKFTSDGILSGFLTNGDGFTSGRPESGKPLAGISLFLYDNAGRLVGHAITDANGFYTFTNLPLGTYTITVNLPGVPPVSRTVTLQAKTTIPGINFELINGRLITVSTKNGADIEANIWPNPTTDILHVELPVSATLYLTNALSKPVATYEYTAAQPIQLDLSGQPAGVYFLHMRTDSGKTRTIPIVKL